jgi:6-phosphogluconolactonase
MTDGTIDYGERGRVVVLPDARSLAQHAAELLRDLTREVVADRANAYIALSGGSTPKAMGAILGAQPMRDEVPWGSLHVFWGDERWAPIDSPDSNAGEALRGYLDSVPIPRSQVHPFETSGDPAESAANYERLIKTVVPGSPMPMFDLILLGMGDDGHTASLFPGTAALAVTDRLVAENQVEKLNATRLTFTAPLINAARHVAFLVTGAGKAERLAQVLDGPQDPMQLPSQLVRPTHGQLTWLVDKAAAADLAREPR